MDPAALKKAPWSSFRAFLGRFRRRMRGKTMKIQNEMRKTIENPCGAARVTLFFSFLCVCLRRSRRRTRSWRLRARST